MCVCVCLFLRFSLAFFFSATPFFLMFLSPFLLVSVFCMKAFSQMESDPWMSIQLNREAPQANGKLCVKAGLAEERVSV